MKYARRDSMFETNSSSTHSLILMRGEPEKPVKDEDDEWNERAIRQVRSPAMKGMLLLQFYIQYYEAYKKPSEQDVASFGEVERGELMAEQLLHDSFIAAAIKRMGPLDEDQKHVLDRVLKESANDTPACDECFCNGVLDFCDGCLHFEQHFVKLCGQLNSVEDIEPFLDKFFADDVLFVVEEGWYGGDWYDIPEVL